MTAPRPREQAGPPSPPDRLPPRRGGPSPSTAAVAGPLAALARYPLVAVACLGVTGALALPVAAQTLSDDATLSALVVNDGSADLPLEPAFNPALARFIDEYYVDVSHDVETVTVTATPNHAGATVEYSPSNVVSLEVGYQTITIDVTSEDDSDDNTYKVGVFRAPPATPSCTLNPGDIWCSRFIVNRNAPGLLGANIGDLSDFDFTYEGHKYRFRSIRLNNDELRVIFYPFANSLVAPAALRALDKLSLQVENESFHFSESERPFWSTAHNPWSNSGLEWSEGTTVTVRVRVNTDQGLFDVGTVVSSPDPSIEKVFRFNLKAEAYRFRISTDARVTVTDPDGTELWKESLNSGSVLEERFTSTVAGEHKVTISHAAWVSARPFYFTLLPVNEEPAATLSLRRDPQITATLNTYGDRDTWGVSVDGGAAYAVRVRGREDGQGTAATPSIRRTDPPGSYTDYRMDKPWVDGVSIAKASALCHQLAEPEKCEYQAFVIDLRGVTGAEQRFEIDVGPTQRPDTRPYREGTYEVDLRQLSSSQLQGVRMPLRAWFTSPPAQHDGSKRFKVRMGFSDALDGSPEDGVEVKGGEVTSVGPAEGNASAGAGAARGAAPPTTRSVGGPDGEVVWEFEIEPDSDADVTVSVAAWRPCNEPGAICTPDERVLSQGDSTTVRGPGDGPAPNTPAAGAPTIGGTPQVGEELTASTSEISDADGLEDASFAYQWIRTDTDIEGATGATYTAVDADEGKTLEVRVDFTDDAGNEESLTSAATDVVAAALEPLTARFENVPSEHDGSAFTLRMAFSERLSMMNGRRLREDVVAVSGGRATSAGRVNRRRDLWELTVEPDSLADVTVTLAAGAACGTPAAICTSDGRSLSEGISTTVAGPADDGPEPNTPATGAPTIGGTPRVGDELTASTPDISDADGLADARFAYQWIRADTDISGATGSAYTAVEADEGERLKVRVSFTDDAGNEESLTSAATDAVAARPEPLTASFEDVPAEHDGESAFTLRIASSDRLSMMDGRRLREDVVEVSGGRATSAGRVNRRRDLWELTVEPHSSADVTMTVAAGAACGTPAAVCTSDGRALSNTISATVRGPVGIAVADAHVEEDDGAVLAFAVTLSRAASRALTVDYATSDGSAQAGVDYTAASGTLTFQAGESSKTIEVGVLDDAHDEGEETLTLRLSSASGGLLTDGEATGTIENRDPLPRALLARFGRTAAVHVVEHVEERLQAPREPGFRGRFAGRELRRGMERDLARGFLQRLGWAAGAGSMGAGVGSPMGGSPAAGAAAAGMPGRGGGGALMMGAGRPMSGAAGMAGGGASLQTPGLGAAGPTGAAAGPGGGFFGGGLLSMGLGGGDLLTGSDFAMNRESRGGILSFWSRGAQSRFSGREGALSLGGDVRTTMFGADYARGPVVAGLSLSNSRGLGEYAGVAGGQVASSVTGLYPWLGYKMTERVTVWGVAGYGTGGLLLTPDSGQALESGLSMAMAAAGTRGELVAGGASGFGLAFKADALWVGTAIDGVDGPAGRLKATDAAVTRFRTGLEGSRAYTLAGRLSLTPSVEVGLRHDGGDAETGAGMDVGAGLVVSDAGTGLAVDVRVRTLLVHQDEDFSERGVAVSLSYNPTPSTPLGFLARVAPSWGGQATSGAAALWGRETMGGMAQGGIAQGNSLDAEVGYGLPVGSRLVGMPKLGLRTSEYGKDYRLGYSLGVLSRERLAFELGVEAQRRESPMMAEGASNGVLGQASLGW